MATTIYEIKGLIENIIENGGKVFLICENIVVEIPTFQKATEWGYFGDTDVDAYNVIVGSGKKIYMELTIIDETEFNDVLEKGIAEKLIIESEENYYVF